MGLFTARYASYGGRFEMAIVNQMIKDAGADKEFIETEPPKVILISILLLTV